MAVQARRSFYGCACVAAQILGIFNHGWISATQCYGEMDHGGRGAGIRQWLLSMLRRSMLSCRPYSGRFSANGAGLFWVLNAYLLMLAALILIGGVLGDKLGRKRVYMTGIVVFLVGSVACGCSVSTVMLIIFRIVQGAGGALMIPGSLTMLSALIAEDERGKAIGTWSAFTTMVTLGGPILGGSLADAGLWRDIFFVNVPLGVVALLILWRKVPESKASEGEAFAGSGGGHNGGGGVGAGDTGLPADPGGRDGGIGRCWRRWERVWCCWGVW